MVLMGRPCSVRNDVPTAYGSRCPACHAFKRNQSRIVLERVRRRAALLGRMPGQGGDHVATRQFFTGVNKVPDDGIRKDIELLPVVQRAELQASGHTYAVPAIGLSSSESVRLDGLTNSLRRGKWTIAGLAVSGMLVGWFISLLTAPVYRAHVSLQLEGFNTERYLKEAPISPSLPNASPENYLQNQVKLLESETLARRVFGAIGSPPDAKPRLPMILVARVRAYLGFLRPSRAAKLEPAHKSVQRAIIVRTSLQSQVIDVYFDAADPGYAARGANTVATEFIALTREARWQLARDTTEWLRKQAAALKEDLATSNRQLEAFSRTSGLVFAGKQSTLAEDQMRQVQDALARAATDRANKQARYEAAVANPFDVMSDAVAGGPLRQFETDLQNLRRELAQLETLYTPENYKVLRVQAQIAETEKAISKERNSSVSRLRTEFIAATELEKLLSIAHASQMKKVQGQMDRERQYELRKSEIDAAQRLYESLQAKVNEAGAASTLWTTNVRMIDPATEPATPYSPNPPLNASLGLALGALGGAGLVLLRQGARKVRRPGDSNCLNIPELGAIPSANVLRGMHSSGRRMMAFPWRRNRDVGLVVSNSDSTLLAESFRAALTSVLFTVDSRDPWRNVARVIVVSSIDVKEGKTTVLSNLGLAAAERRRRVLLIDADLRRPRVHEVVDVANTWGLADLIGRPDLPEFLNTSDVNTLTVPTHIPGLRVLPSGRVRTDTQKQFYGSDLSLLLKRLRTYFDLILIDSPPLMLYSDGRILGRHSDGVLLVVRADTTDLEELKAAHTKLMQDHIPVFGTILNHWNIDPSQMRAYDRYCEHYRQSSAP